MNGRTVSSLFACVVLGLAASAANAKDQPKKPRTPVLYSDFGMCNECDGRFTTERKCNGADEKCCYNMRQACWEWCDDASETGDNAWCEGDAECMRECRARCSRDATTCNGGKEPDPARLPGRGGLRAPWQKATPEPALPGRPGPGGRTVQPVPAVPERAGPPPSQVEQPAPTKPGFIWVDNHWERPRRKN